MKCATVLALTGLLAQGVAADPQDGRAEIEALLERQAEIVRHDQSEHRRRPADAIPGTSFAAGINGVTAS